MPRAEAAVAIPKPKPVPVTLAACKCCHGSGDAGSGTAVRSQRLAVRRRIHDAIEEETRHGVGQGSRTAGVTKARLLVAS